MALINIAVTIGHLVGALMSQVIVMVNRTVGNGRMNSAVKVRTSLVWLIIIFL